MPARRVTTVTVPVDVRSGVAVEAYQARTPLLTIRASVACWKLVYGELSGTMGHVRCSCTDPA
jgi:hypothetical protein